VPLFVSFTLAFALQLRKKHGKTSVRVRKTCQVKIFDPSGEQTLSLQNPSGFSLGCAARVSDRLLKALHRNLILTIMVILCYRQACFLFYIWQENIIRCYNVIV
jgi:hypothetical protein